MAAYFNSGYPGISKELLATASDISFCLVVQKLWWGEVIKALNCVL